MEDDPSRKQILIGLGFLVFTFIILPIICLTHGKGPIVEFEQVKSIREFRIVINGMKIDDHVSPGERSKYYDLCRSQKAYLHEHLHEGVDTVHWAAAIVSKTVWIADSIRALNVSTPRSEYDRLDKILCSFEVLRLNVGFLRARVGSLARFVSESGEEFEGTRSEVEERIKRLQSVIRNLEDRRTEFALQIKERNEEYENRFKELVNRQW